MQNNYISKTHVNKIATDLQTDLKQTPVLDHCCAICGSSSILYGLSSILYGEKAASIWPPPAKKDEKKTRLSRVSLRVSLS